jgi:hypothetical protein
MALAPVKISGMNDAAALTGAEVFPAVQSGGNVKATLDAIKDFTLAAFFSSGGTITDRVIINKSGSGEEEIAFIVGLDSPFSTVYNAGSETAVYPAVQVVHTGTPASFLMARVSNNTGPGRIFFAKARGTDPEDRDAVIVNDQLGGFAFAGADGTQMRDGAHIVAQVTASPTGDRIPTRLRFETTDGSAAVGNRLSVEADGSIAMGTGFNTVISNERAFINRTTNLAGLSGFTHAVGKQLVVTDIGGGNGLVISDGTNWRRGQETGTNSRSTDAAFTLTPLTDAPDQLCTGTLTADRAITLSTTGAYDGARFRITRTGAGAFNYTVAHNGGTKNIATNQWAEFVYFTSLAAWQLVAAGSL